MKVVKGLFLPVMWIYLTAVWVHAQDLGGMQQLRIPAQQLQQLREQSTNGGVGNQQIQRLCASIAARHLSPADVRAIGASLGLSDDDAARLVDCARLSAGRPAQFGPSNESSRNITNREELSGPSQIEEQFHAADMPYKLLAAPDLSRLKQFGYELFSGRTADIDAINTVPVGPDYVIEPGDELNILLWGRINRTLKLLVQRDGTVLMPQVGPLAVAGFNLAQTQS